MTTKKWHHFLTSQRFFLFRSTFSSNTGPTHLAEAELGGDLVHCRSFGVVQQFQAVLSGVLTQQRQTVTTEFSPSHPPAGPPAASHLGGLVDGCHLRPEAQGDVFVLSVPAIQVAHPLTARLPPEVQETVGGGVILKHDVVHVSVFLEGEQRTFTSGVLTPLPNGGGS